MTISQNTMYLLKHRSRRDNLFAFKERERENYKSLYFEIFKYWRYSRFGKGQKEMEKYKAK